MQNSTRGTYWTFLIFEDNIEKNPRWLYRLLDTHLRFVVSPYHDHDLWTIEDKDKHPEREDIIPGKPKKAHYHVMVQYDDNTTFKNVKSLTEELGLPIPFRVQSPRGLLRYFYHIDNQEKYQYDINDIKYYNGAQPEDYLIEIGKYQRLQIKQELRAFMRKYKYTRMSEFWDGVSVSFKDPNYQYIAEAEVNYFKEVLKDNISDMKTSIMAEARKTV